MKEKQQIFERNIKEHLYVLERLDMLQYAVSDAAEMIVAALVAGGTVFLCGNGGSAADAQHFAAELSGRYLKERKALNGIALHANTSALTAIANDYGFEEIYARQIEAHARAGDVLVAISTSGNSANVLRAIEAARTVGAHVIGMTGGSQGKMSGLCDILLSVPSDATPRIQEMHILISHMICEMIELSFPHQGKCL